MNVASADCSKNYGVCQRAGINMSQTVFYLTPVLDADTTDKLVVTALEHREVAAQVLHQLPEDTVLDEAAFNVIHSALIYEAICSN